MTREMEGNVDKETARQMVANATDLDDLLRVLRQIEDSLERPEDGDWAVRLCELVDVTSLPTYGGECPTNSAGVWSYDAGRVLVGEGSFSACTIEPRAVLERAGGEE